MSSTSNFIRMSSLISEDLAIDQNHLLSVTHASSSDTGVLGSLGHHNENNENQTRTEKSIIKPIVDAAVTQVVSSSLLVTKAATTDRSHIVDDHDLVNTKMVEQCCVHTHDDEFTLSGENDVTAVNDMSPESAEHFVFLNRDHANVKMSETSAAGFNFSLDDETGFHEPDHDPSANDECDDINNDIAVNVYVEEMLNSAITSPGTTYLDDFNVLQDDQEGVHSSCSQLSSGAHEGCDSHDDSVRSGDDTEVTSGDIHQQPTTFSSVLSEIIRNSGLNEDESNYVNDNFQNGDIYDDYDGVMKKMRYDTTESGMETFGSEEEVNDVSMRSPFLKGKDCMWADGSEVEEQTPMSRRAILPQEIEKEAIVFNNTITQQHDQDNFPLISDDSCVSPVSPRSQTGITVSTDASTQSLGPFSLTQLQETTRPKFDQAPRPNNHSGLSSPVPPTAHQNQRTVNRPTTYVKPMKRSVQTKTSPPPKAKPTTHQHTVSTDNSLHKRAAESTMAKLLPPPPNMTYAQWRDLHLSYLHWPQMTGGARSLLASNTDFEKKALFEAATKAHQKTTGNEGLSNEQSNTAKRQSNRKDHNSRNKRSVMSPQSPLEKRVDQGNNNLDHQEQRKTTQISQQSYVNYSNPNIIESVGPIFTIPSMLSQADDGQELQIRSTPSEKHQHHQSQSNLPTVIDFRQADGAVIVNRRTSHSEIKPMTLLLFAQHNNNGQYRCCSSQAATRISPQELPNVSQKVTSTENQQNLAVMPDLMNCVSMVSPSSSNGGENCTITNDENDFKHESEMSRKLMESKKRLQELQQKSNYLQAENSNLFVYLKS